MWRQDIRGSKAHATMLAHQGVISQQDADAIRAGLDDIADQIERGEFTFDVDRDEDIHMAIERVLTENIGPAGGRLHTGRSRNDQTAVDTHLIARDLADEILASLAKLEAVLLDRAQGEELGLAISLEMAKAALPYADGLYLMTPFNRVALMERLIGRLKQEVLGAY